MQETEKRTIASVSGTTITLTEGLTYSHMGTETTVDGNTFQMRASVGILSRNVRIVGNIYTDLMTTAWSPCAGWSVYARCDIHWIYKIE